MIFRTLLIYRLAVLISSTLMLQEEPQNIVEDDNNLEPSIHCCTNGDEEEVDKEDEQLIDNNLNKLTPQILGLDFDISGKSKEEDWRRGHLYRKLFFQHCIDIITLVM
ncbi:hypothetical protein ACFX19_038671 [Malus domestica]